MSYSNEDLKKRYSSPEMQRLLTIAYPGVSPDDPMLKAFSKAAEGILDVKDANKFLARFMEEAQALKGAK